MPWISTIEQGNAGQICDEEVDWSKGKISVIYAVQPNDRCQNKRSMVLGVKIGFRVSVRSLPYSNSITKKEE